jgi:Fe-S-cluster containining protein
MNKEDLKILKQKAAREAPFNKKFFQKLRKNKKSNHLDRVVHDLHIEVFNYINCLECANCCKSISPIVHDKDIARISRKLKLRPSEFTSNYLKIDEEGDYVFKETPCPFLLPDNYCSIYEYRPRSCKEFPLTDQVNFHRLFNLTIKNSYICPAVFDIIEKLKERFTEI